MQAPPENLRSASDSQNTVHIHVHISKQFRRMVEEEWDIRLHYGFLLSNPLHKSQWGWKCFSSDGSKQLHCKLEASRRDRELSLTELFLCVCMYCIFNRWWSHTCAFLRRCWALKHQKSFTLHQKHKSVFEHWDGEKKNKCNRLYCRSSEICQAKWIVLSTSPFLIKWL